MMNQHQSMGRDSCVGDGHQYHQPKLKELCHYSEAISSCWIDLALELDLPFEIINTIDKDHDNIKDKCRNMFNTWLERSPDACWCHIANALKMHNMLQLAKDIEQSFLSVTFLMDIGSSSNQSNNTSFSVEDSGSAQHELSFDRKRKQKDKALNDSKQLPSSETKKAKTREETNEETSVKAGHKLKRKRKQEMGNDEGCQDIEFRSLESRDIQNLDGDGDNVLRLPRKRPKTSKQIPNTVKQTSRTCNIEDHEEKFNKNDVENSFVYMLDKLEKLWSDVELSRLKSTCIKDVRLSKKIKKNVKSTDTLREIFNVLANTPFCTWLDIRILNSMADVADNPEASEMLAAFENCVHHRKCSEVIGHFRKQQFRNPKHFAKVIAKLSKTADYLNVAKLIEYSQRLENVLHLPPNSSTVVGSESGCLEIHLIIPKYCLLHAYETSKNCFLKLRPFNIQYLQIGTFSKVYATNLTRTMQAKSFLAAISSHSGWEYPSQVIDHYYTYLEGHMDADSVSHMMHSEQLITDSDYEAITAAPNDININRLLLQYIRVMDKTDLLKFCNVLRSIETQRCIGDNLEISLKSTAEVSQRQHITISPTKLMTNQCKNVSTIFLEVLDQLTTHIQEQDKEFFVEKCCTLMASPHNKHNIKLFTNDFIKKLFKCSHSTLLKFYLLPFITWLDNTILIELTKVYEKTDTLESLCKLICIIDYNQPITSYPIPTFSQLIIPLDDSDYTIVAIKMFQNCRELILRDVTEVKKFLILHWELTAHAIQLAAIDYQYNFIYWVIPKQVKSLVENKLSSRQLELWHRGIFLAMLLPKNYFSADHDFDQQVIDDPFNVTKLLKQDSMQAHQLNLEDIKVCSKALQDEIYELKLKLDIKHEELNDLEDIHEENAKLKSHLQEVGKQIKKLECMKVHTNLLYEENSELKSQLEIQQKVLIDTENIKVLLKEENSELQSQLEVWQKLHKNTEDTTVLLHKENAVLKSQLEVQQKVLIDTENIKVLLKEENSELQSQLEVQQKLLVDSKSTTVHLQEENTTLQSQLEVRQKLHKNTEDTTVLLQKENAELKSQLEVQQKVLIDTENIKVLLKEKNSELQSQLEVRQKLLVDSKSTTVHLQEENTTLQSQLEVWQKLHKNTEDTTVLLQKENAVLKSQLEVQQKVLIDTENTIVLLKEENSELQSQLEVQQKLLVDSESTTAQEENTTLKSELEFTQKCIKSLEVKNTWYFNKYGNIKEEDTETFLEKAIEENQVINFQHIKILLIGSAAVGKTSFCRLLFHHKFCGDYKSTEVIEASQAISVEAKTNQNISVEQYVEIEQQTHKEIVWLKLDAKNQLAHFKSLLESRVFHVPETTTTIPEQITLQNSVLGFTDSAIIHEETVDKREIDNESKFSAFKTVIQEKSVGKVETEVKETTELKDKTEVKEKILSSDALPDALFIDEDNKSVKLITVIDAGGQLEYIHLLPAINSCPNISFIVLDMTKSLDEKVLVQYKSDSDKTEPYYLHYSNLNMIGLLMSLTVDSLEQKAEDSHVLDSRIGFVGTHKDVLIEKKIDEKTIAEINSKLCQITDEGIRKKMFSSNNDFLFPVDNTTAGDSDKEDPVIKELRKHIDDFMNYLLNSHQLRSENKLPIKWMILELEIKELHLRKYEYLSYVDYKRIAHDKAKMEAEEANESLQHFNFLGIFLYFKEVDGLRDYVIINHKWLFKNLAKLLHLSTDQIDFRNLDHKEKFKDKRLLAKSEVDKIEWNETFSPEYFFNLLVHLKVIATVSLEKEQYYYMPCIRSSTYHYHDKHIFPLSEPLLVQFSSGFLPRGFFGSLVVDLLENLLDEWHPQFHNTKHFSNVITFQLPDDSFLRLHDKLYYLEVQIRHYKRDLKVDYHAEVFPKLRERLHHVCKKLSFDYEKLKYGFLCNDSKFYDDEHIAIINPFSPLPSNLRCMPSKIRCCRKDAHQLTLDKSHKIWFKKITNEASSEQSPDMQLSCDRPALKHLNKYVRQDVSAKWHDLGLELLEQADEGKLNEIRSNHPQNNGECCKQMFQLWLEKSQNPTWSQLIQALRVVGLNQLASKVNVMLKDKKFEGIH